MKTKNKIILLIGIVLAVVLLLVFIPKGNNTPSKYDQFAQALKSNGAVFYGAFWCPHCQAQKAEFGSSVKYLPYVECSNPDRSQIQVCIDKKIEGYPSWTFKDGINLISDKQPLVCDIKTPTSVETDACKNRSSQNGKTWYFPDYSFSIESPTDPIKDGTTWKFPSEAMASGEIPISFLAEQINFTLPQ